MFLHIMYVIAGLGKAMELPEFAGIMSEMNVIRRHAHSGMLMRWEVYVQGVHCFCDNVRGRQFRDVQWMCEGSFSGSGHEMACVFGNDSSKGERLKDLNQS